MFIITAANSLSNCQMYIIVVCLHSLVDLLSRKRQKATSVIYMLVSPADLPL